MSDYRNLSAMGRARIDYFKAIVTRITEGKDDGAAKALQKNMAVVYDELHEQKRKVKLYEYLDGKLHKNKARKKDFIIFPFGINESQRTAVQEVVSHEASVIEGPPGTGKTQTILNIIANALINGENIAVVSNNNNAVINVKEKLEKEGMGFIAAYLGKRENVDKFLANQSDAYPDMDAWKLSVMDKQKLKDRITSIHKELAASLYLKNRKAQLVQEKAAFSLEEEYYLSYFEESDWADKKDSITGIHSAKLLEIFNLLEDLEKESRPVNWLVKCKLWYRYNWKMMKLIVTPKEGLKDFLQREFYRLKEEEIVQEMEEVESKLQNYSFDGKMEELKTLSMQYLKAYIADRYNCRRQIFNNFYYKADEFTREYPVVLSTTYSVKRLFKSMIYDYIVVDEASQVDTVTGVLALSCAKKCVIVGDLRQLPNVMTGDTVKTVDDLWQDELGEPYCYHKENLLSSVKKAWPEVSTTLLQEHYRCHPQIIGFCNEKFYDGQLIIMTDEEEGDKALTLYKTSKGNHANGLYNQREIDIIAQEIIPQFDPSEYKDIGIISPFNDQVEGIQKAIHNCCDVATVHKFQGREKKYIVISTVQNAISDFAADPSMVNVAVSRAVEKLFVVTSGNDVNENTLYGDLVKYIEYHNLEILESKVTSVFDLLYKANREARWEYLKKHERISEYDSENLLYGVITEVLADDAFRTLGCAVHVPLAHTIKDNPQFTDDERAFIKRSWSHNDFVIYDRMNKQPILAIEVDGATYHQEGSEQAEKRDALKNGIFEKVGMPLLRLRTDGSGEKEKITERLKALLPQKDQIEEEIA